MDLLRKEFELIKRIRHCPSFEEIKEGGQEIENHLKSCQICLNIKKNINEWDELNKTFLAMNTSSVSIEDEPTLGDICLIANHNIKRTDESGIFYNSPYVVILNKGNKKGLVEVAQIFIGNDLAWAGDIYLCNSLGGYAESWNIYDMRLEWLLPIGEKVGEDILQGILQLKDYKFPYTTNNEIIRQFRDDEIKTKNFFSSFMTDSVSYPSSKDNTNKKTITWELEQIVLPREETLMAAAGEDESVEELNIKIKNLGRTSSKFKEYPTITVENKNIDSFKIQILDKNYKKLNFILLVDLNDRDSTNFIKKDYEKNNIRIIEKSGALYTNALLAHNDFYECVLETPATDFNLNSCSICISKQH